MKAIGTVALGIVIAELAAGCATSGAGGPSTVAVYSEPPGAYLRIGVDDKASCNTPCAVPGDRPLEIYLSKEGYETAARVVDPTRGGRVDLELSAPVVDVEATSLDPVN